MDDAATLAALNRRFRLRRAWLIVRRNVLVFRTARLALLSGMIEPLVYLLTLGVLLDRMVGTVTVSGQTVDYLSYVAPGLLAATTMTVVVNESVSNLFYKLRISRAYDAVLAAPVSGVDIVVGELGWTLMRTALCAAPFILAMAGLGVASRASVPLLLLGTLIEAIAFGAVGLAVATYLRTWQQRDLVQVVVLPMFYLCGTLFPVQGYPEAVRALVTITPLYPCVELLRSWSVGVAQVDVSFSLAYLGLMTVVGGAVAVHRIETLLRR